MKERILGSLKALADYVPGKAAKKTVELLAALVEETALTETEIISNSAACLQLILHRYSEFAVSTIDSFSNRILKSFAFDFRIPPDFLVELDSELLLTAAVNIMLDKAGEDEELTRILINFLENRVEDEQDWKITEIFIRFAGNLLDEAGYANLEILRAVPLGEFTKIATDLRKNYREFENNVTRIARKAVMLIKDRNILTEDFYQGKSGIGKYFLNLTLGNFDKIKPNKNVLKTVEDDKWVKNNADPSVRSSIDEIKHELAGYFQEIRDLDEQYGQLYSLRKMLAETIYPVALLHEIDKCLTSYKQHNNLVHIAEFNRRIAAVIMNEPVPFIYERIGEKYHHILVDEFQDTSVLQWMNLLPLIENSLAGGYLNLVVGDGKQAIYRWRNGDIDQFIELPRIPGSDLNPLLRQRESSLVRHHQPEKLDVNFRSKSVIVEFNNSFFRFASDNALYGRLKSVYQDVCQKIRSSEGGGYVSIEFPSEKLSKAEFQEYNFSAILEIISRAVSHNYRNRDIAILCRSNDNASSIASFLIQNNIQVVSAESLLVKNSQKVKMLIALLKDISGLSDDIVREEISMYILENKCLKPWNEIKQALLLSVLPVYDLCETLIRKFGMNQEPDPFILFFLDIVLKFSSSVSQNPTEFLAHWEQNKEKFSITVPEEMDAIRIMTIHKAKGLQFPVVIFPFATDSVKHAKKYLWIEPGEEVAPGLETALVKTVKELNSTSLAYKYQEEHEKSALDMLNVLYVVLTRAEDQLFVISSYPPDNIEEKDTVPKLLKLYLVDQGLWSKEQFVYEFGKPAFKTTRPGEAPLTVSVLDKFLSSDWKERVKIKTRYNDEWFNNNRERKNWGKRVHTVLSRVMVKDDVAEAVNMAMDEGIINPEEAGELRITMEKLVSHPELAECFSPGVVVKTEPEILSGKGAVYRPDRVVIRNQSVTIIDYKTGLHRQEHFNQLTNYARLLEKMGYKDIRSLVVYLEPEPEVVKINC